MPGAPTPALLHLAGRVFVMGESVVGCTDEIVQPNLTFPMPMRRRA